MALDIHRSFKSSALRHNFKNTSDSVQSLHTILECFSYHRFL